MSEVQKTQNIRLVDVFLIAPYLGYVAYKGSVNKNDKLILTVLAVATLVYNGKNYLENRKYGK